MISVLYRTVSMKKARPMHKTWGEPERSRYHPISGSCPQTLVLLKQKDTFISIFHPLATSFDTFVDFSAPPLSVKCGIQNTSNALL